MTDPSFPHTRTEMGYLKFFILIEIINSLGDYSEPAGVWKQHANLGLITNIKCYNFLPHYTEKYKLLNTTQVP